VRVLSFTDSITEHDDLLGLSLGVLLEHLKVRFGHVAEVFNDFPNNQPWLTNAGEARLTFALPGDGWPARIGSGHR
jgi:hypothetical protein